MARITLFAGRFGSGKSEIAMNYAANLAALGGEVALVDLDIVTPYYRTRDESESLAGLGVEVVSPTTFGRYSEPVGITPAILGALQNPSRQVVVDVGGDPSGARVLGMYAEQLEDLGYDFLLVVNPFRPATASEDRIVRAVEAIERSSRLSVSGLVSNPNLLDETTPQLVLDGHHTVAAAANILGLPLRMLCLDKALATAPELSDLGPEVLWLTRRLRPLWDEQPPTE